MAGDRAGTGSWALGSGHWRGDWEQQNSAQAPRQPKPTGPTRWGWPRDQQGRPLLGVYHQLSGPERLKRGIRPMLPILCARGSYCEIWPGQPLRRLATRARPQFETPRETRYPSWPRHTLFLPLSLPPLQSRSRVLASTKDPDCPLQIRELERPCGRHNIATLEIGSLWIDAITMDTVDCHS